MTAHKKAQRATHAAGVAAVGLAVALLPGRLLFAQSDGEPLEARLARIDERTRGIDNLRVDFVEEKFTALLYKPLVSRGHVLVKGGRTRWETTSPHRSILYTNESRVAIYFPSRSTVEIYPIDRRLRPLIVSPLPQLSMLRRHFNMESIASSPPPKAEDATNTLDLRLTPKDEALRDIISEVHVRIDETLGLLVRAVLVDPEGDRTVITFSHARPNAGVTDADVKMALPPEVREVRPLGSSVAETRPSGADPR